MYRYGEEEEEFIISGDCNEELGFHRLVGFAYGAESGATTAWIGVALLLLLLTCLFPLCCQQAASTPLEDRFRRRISYCGARHPFMWNWESKGALTRSICTGADTTGRASLIQLESIYLGMNGCTGVAVILQGGT